MRGVIGRSNEELQAIDAWEAFDCSATLTRSAADALAELVVLARTVWLSQRASDALAMAVGRAWDRVSDEERTNSNELLRDALEVHQSVRTRAIAAEEEVHEAMARLEHRATAVVEKLRKAANLIEDWLLAGEQDALGSTGED